MLDADGPVLRALTFNIRYDEPADGRHAWPHRRDLAIATICAQDADLIALQEPTANQWTEIRDALPEYTAFGVWSDDWGAIEPRGGFVRSSRFDVVDEGLFWLSDTPAVPQSVTWPNDWGPRSCAWIRLRDRRSDRRLIFAGTHFDTNAESWLPSARLIGRELPPGTPTILAGDFNSPAGSDAHTYLLQAAGFRDAWYDAGETDAGVVTYHEFAGTTRLATPGNVRLDWILLRGFSCVAARIDTRRDGDALPSDHYPVVADVKWPEPARGSLRL